MYHTDIKQISAVIVLYILSMHMSSRYLLKGEKMGKNLEPQYAFRCDETTIKKLEYIAKKNTRTRNQEMKHIIKTYIQEYENKHGEIIIEPITREKAKENFKESITNRKENGILETMKKSFKDGFDFGNADK